MRNGYRSEADHNLLCSEDRAEAYRCPRCQAMNCLCTGSADCPICDVCWDILNAAHWSPGDMVARWPW